MNARSDNNPLSTQLLQTAHLNDASGLLTTLTPDLSLDPIRRRADAAHAAVARTGRFRYAHWGAFCLVLALALIGAAMLVPTASLTLAGIGAAILALGLALILLFDPKPALQHVDAFDRFCIETQEQWAIATEAQSKTAIQPIIEAVQRFPRDTIANGAGVRSVAEALHQAEARTRKIETEMENLQVAAFQAAKRGEEECTNQMNRLRTSARNWSSRLWAGLVRRPANRALDARESLLAAKRQMMILQVAREVAVTPMIQVLLEVVEDLETTMVGPLTAIADAASQQVSEYAKQGTRGTFGKIIPSPQEIVVRSREIIATRLPSIARSVANRQDDVPVQQSIEQEVQAVLTNNTVIPKRLIDCLEEMNGGIENALAQMTDEAGELAVSKLTPGRVPRRLRTVIVHGGPSSVLSKAIERRSEGCTVRAIEHDSEKELIEINECRFEPGAELIELREASEALNLLPEEMKAVMVTAVEDDELVLAHCRPEQRTEPERGVKLLLRGLVFDRLTRRGNTYQFNGVPGTDGSSNGCLAKSFEAAAEVLQADAQQARRLQQAIDAETEARGLEGACKAIQSALNRPDLVPGAHANRARKILTEELRQMKRALSANGAG